MKEKIIRRSIDDFPFFVEAIFSHSKDVLKDGKWTGGKHPDKIAHWLASNDKTLRVSAKDHFKSMSFYAHIMWKILRMRFIEQAREIQYFSYKESMASYHTGKIKVAIACNPFFSEVIDLKSKAESVLSYKWFADGTKLTVTPRGLLEFKRGIHCDDVYVDDPLQDPENKMILTKIDKVNDIMKTQIMDMYQKELHVVGTAQTQQDFFFDPDFTHRFNVVRQPAILNEEKKEVLWPEWMSFDELMSKKRERGAKVFNQEYMVSPVYSEEAFITQDYYDACVNRSLINYTPEKWEEELARRDKQPNYEERDVVGGFDIGKKAHPSHLALFEHDHEQGIWVQIHSKWMDNWDYRDQLEYLKRAADSFKMYVLYYDNTRGEFEAFDEGGDLPAAMEPINFTVKTKHSLATQFDKALGNKEVELLSDERQRGQVLVVNNDLKAPESPEGHGDSFWSICMGLKDYGGGGSVDVTMF